MNLNDLASFAHVVELGTLTAAAEREGVPKSTISRRVARLEAALGVALLRRSSRSFSITDDGQQLYERARGALRELSDVEQVLTRGQEAPTGTLVLTAPHDVGSVPIVAALLARYRREHPGVRLELRLENRIVDLVAEGIDVALRGHAADHIPGDGLLMARVLTTTRMVLYAHRDYLARHPAPQRPEDLHHHALIAHHTLRRGPITLTRGESAQPEDTVTLQLEAPACVANDFSLIHGLVMQAAGLAFLPSATATEALATGQLVRVLPGWSGQAGRLSLIWPASRHLAPRVRAFLDLATAHFRSHPNPDR